MNDAGAFRVLGSGRSAFLPGWFAVLQLLAAAPAQAGSALDALATPWNDPLLARPPVLNAGTVLPGDTAPPRCLPADVEFGSLTPAQAVDIALCHNPQVQVAWAAIKIQGAAAVSEARAAHRPTVTLNAGCLGDRAWYPSSNQVAVTSRGNAAYGSVGWRLFDFGARQANQPEKFTTLTAPVVGTVQQLATHTEGGMVTEARTLMVIVPDEARVMTEATLENKDIGLVDVEQHAAIKLETSPDTRYDTIPATVKTVAADAVNDERRGAVFPVTLAPDAAAIDVDGKAIELSPGMNLTAEIKTGKWRVVEFLLSPVQQAASESLGER